jgi:hypothetical protein
VLAAAGGVTNAAIARGQGVSVNTVRKWRGRFVALGLEGLKDAKRPGRPGEPLTPPAHERLGFGHLDEQYRFPCLILARFVFRHELPDPDRADQTTRQPASTTLS